MPHVCHWEIAARDAAALQSFYRKLFDWEIDANNPMQYGMARTGGQTGNGIDGGIYPACEDTPAYVSFYVFVEDLQAYLDRAASLGGKTLVPPTPLPDGDGHIAMFADPEGNRIGLYSERG
ncbi:MAG TPA: VOC family protein [Chthonomonadaceae bacterium]|nr:VOC family protein [Chthonomonadaceae bacterium]